MGDCCWLLVVWLQTTNNNKCKGICRIARVSMHLISKISPHILSKYRAYELLTSHNVRFQRINMNLIIHKLS